MSRSERLFAVFPPAAMLLFVPVLCWNVANHPFNLSFYNFWAGGLSSAQARGFPQATDYWGSSYRAAVKRLNAEAPGQALLFVGVGRHILQPVAAHWLLPDIELRRFKQLSAALASGETRPIYLILHHAHGPPFGAAFQA
ncbi:MAG: hypothetical protein ABW298_07300 [Candidatus Binatia bacterium]